MKKLAIIGAGYLQLPLVEKAKEMGIYTICFAWEKGAVCNEICDEFHPISITEKESILKVCKKLIIDGIASIASDVAVPTVNFVAANLNLKGNSIESGLLSTNKFMMRNAFNASNISIPNYVEISNLDNLEKIRFLNLPLIIKPVDRSGSKGITVVKSIKKIKHAVQYALNESFIKRAIVEEFISGEEISVEVISWKGRHHILAYTDKVTTGFPHFVELEHHQPSKYLNADIKSQIDKLVISGLDSLLIKNGASHVELIISSNHDIYVTEIGARMGGDFIGSDLVFLSTGYDYLKGVINISFGIFNNPLLKENQYSGVYFYSNCSSEVKNYILKGKSTIIKSELNKLKNTEIKESSDRSGYFIYQSNKRINLV